MAKKGPGKHFRQGITTRQFYKMFDEATAEAWFIQQRWPIGVCCPHCGSLNVNLKSKHKTMPFRCREKGCYKQFSVKVGTFMHSSPIDYVDWLYVLYLVSTNLKGVSSMRLHRDLGRTQKTAWHVAHRVRKLMGQGKHLFSGPIECDETFIGGKRKNMRPERRKQLTGRGPVGKVAIAGIRDRATKQVAAQPVPDTTSETLSGFIADRAVPGVKVFTDDAVAYKHLPNHRSVKHSVAEYVRGDVHTNGVESFWAGFKRGHYGTFHRLSPKHLHRYVDEFVGRHNIRDLDTLDQMAAMAKRIHGTRLSYKALVA